MQPGLQNCCRQCCCKQFYQEPIRSSYQRPTSQPVNNQQNTKYCSCTNRNNRSQRIQRDENMFVVCCKECIISGSPAEKPIASLCSCCSCTKCPLCLIKRVCKDAWEDLERQKPQQDRYPLFDGGQRLSYEQYPRRRPSEYGGYNRRRDSYGVGCSSGQGDRDSYGDRKSSRGKDRRASQKGGHQRSEESRRKGDDSIKRGGGGRRDHDSGDEDIRGRKSGKSRRRDSEEDDRRGEGSSKKGKSKNGYDSDDERDNRTNKIGRGKRKDRVEKGGEPKGDMDDRGNGKNRGRGVDTDDDNTGGGDAGKGGKGSKGGKSGPASKVGDSSRKGQDDGGKGEASSAMLGVKSRPSTKAGQPGGGDKSGVGSKLGTGDGRPSAQGGRISTLQPGEKTDQDKLLSKGLNPPRGRFDGLDVSATMRMRLEESDLRRTIRSPQVCQPCNTFVPNPCKTNNCCTSCSIVCPQPCFSSQNCCSMPSCVR